MPAPNCVFHPPPTPWPPAIRHNTLRMQSVHGKFLVRDHAWIIQPRVYAITPDDNIEGVVSVNVHDSYVDEFGRSAVMEFQFLTVFPNCAFLHEPSGFYTTATSTKGGTSLEFHLPPYGPEAYLHGNTFWPPHKPLDEGTWMVWIESEVHFRFDLNTDIDWKVAAVIQVYKREPPKLVTTPMPKIPVEGTQVQDLAVLSGCIEPTGTIEWKLYDAGGSVVYDRTVNVYGNGTYYSGLFTIPAFGDSGDWHWHAKYSGDSKNAAAESDDEPFHVHHAFEAHTGADQWEPRDTAIPAIPLRPGIARFSQTTPADEDWFIPTTPP